MEPPRLESWLRSSERGGATTGHPPISSCCEKRMANATAGIREARPKIVRLQVWHLVENLGGVESGGKKVENVNDADSHPAYARTASALLRVDGDAVEQSGLER